MLSTILGFLGSNHSWIFSFFTFSFFVKLALLVVLLFLGARFTFWKFGIVVFAVTYLADDPSPGPGQSAPGTKSQAYRMEFRLNWGDPMFQFALFWNGKALFNFWRSNWWSK